MNKSPCIKYKHTHMSPGMRHEPSHDRINWSFGKFEAFRHYTNLVNDKLLATVRCFMFHVLYLFTFGILSNRFDTFWVYLSSLQHNEPVLYIVHLTFWLSNHFSVSFVFFSVKLLLCHTFLIVNHIIACRIISRHKTIP